ncbi:hypothetical protein SASC598J21_022290 [Snodgrassella alvi SCGC AB-598-J21]|uniref:Uncharacterized protein n=1 Tax=Snodgrassella alvi SCGC AB-598-J21 TaxID=1385367 RepID=A0A074V4I7_9NEIS|nr:hypothetical protein SASC598J21_022290 [Snodgrassella alvi SCGC AB-598-J21]
MAVFKDNYVAGQGSDEVDCIDGSRTITETDLNKEC